MGIINKYKCTGCGKKVEMIGLQGKEHSGCPKKGKWAMDTKKSKKKENSIEAEELDETD